MHGFAKKSEEEKLAKQKEKGEKMSKVKTADRLLNFSLVLAIATLLAVLWIHRADLAWFVDAVLRIDFQ